MLDMQGIASSPSLAKVSKGTTEEEKLRKACQGFEAIFMNQMMKSMRSASATQEGGLIKKSNAEKIFTEMMDEELSKTAAESSVNGIADIMFNQLKTTLNSATPEEAMKNANPAFFPELRKN
jgi:flagellar protein FlgJ